MPLCRLHDCRSWLASFRAVYDIRLRLLVEFRLRGDADVSLPCLQLGLVEKAQFAVGLVVRYDTAHHQFVQITYLDTEERCRLGCRNQLFRIFHVAVIFR